VVLQAEVGAQPGLALGEEPLHLDLPDDVARPVVGLLEVEELVAPDQAVVEVEPAARGLGGG
jgi:hypothetical protein